MVTIVKGVKSYLLADVISKVDVFDEYDPGLRHKLTPFRSARISGLLDNLHFPCFVILLSLSEMKSFKDRDLHGVLLNCENNAFYAKRSLLQALVLMVLSPCTCASFRSLHQMRN